MSKNHHHHETAQTRTAAIRPGDMVTAPAGFITPVASHGFTRVDENMSEIPDGVNLARLPAIDVNLDEITVASQRFVDEALIFDYAHNPPKNKRVLLRAYGDDVAVVDGHHTVAAARLRGHTTIRARWIDEEDDD